MSDIKQLPSPCESSVLIYSLAGENEAGICVGKKTFHNFG